MNRLLVVLVCAVLVSLTAFPGILLAAAPSTSGNALLSVEAQNDKPGPVTIEVYGWDMRGNPTVATSLVWGADDNAFSVQELEIPKVTRLLRLTFVDDLFIGPGDLDRNAFIDYLMVNNVRYEAEFF